MSAMASVLLALSLIATLPISPSQAEDWSGAYAGVAIGARSMDADWTTTAAIFPAPPPSFPFPLLSNPNQSFKSTDFRGALYAGYNFQISRTYVVGLEADIGIANNEDRFDEIPGLLGFAFLPGQTMTATEVKATWDGSIRLRGGVLVTDTVLLYATGGVAFQRLQETTTCFADNQVCDPAVGTQSFSKSKTLVGWTLGAGIEALLGANWLARAEYRYSDYGNYKFTALTPNNSIFGANAGIDTNTHTVSVGLAFKFPPGNGE